MMRFMVVRICGKRSTEAFDCLHWGSSSQPIKSALRKDFSLVCICSGHGILGHGIL